MVGMSDFSTFSQMTYCVSRLRGRQHRDAVCVFLADALCLGFALLKRMLVLELGFHSHACTAVDPAMLRLD
jgi:hypothetical protein